jgi:hypothetical protein
VERQHCGLVKSVCISPFDGDSEPLELGMLCLVWIKVVFRCILYSFLLTSLFMFLYVSFVPRLEKSLHAVRLVEFRRRFRYVPL